MPILGFLVAAVMTTQPGASDSGAAIIRAMHDRYATQWYRTLTFSQKTYLYGGGDTVVMQIWKERALFPGRLFVDMLRKTDTIEAMYAGDTLYVWRGDKVFQRAKSRNIYLIMGFDVYTQPVERTLEVLASENYPMTPVREDTWMGKRAYVIGDGTHRIWIEKDRLLFMRAIADNRDYRFENYVRVNGGWVAKTVETFSDGRLAQREEYFDVKTNVPVADSQFVPPAGTSAPTKTQ
jgi:hypothetical protein